MHQPTCSVHELCRATLTHKKGSKEHLFIMTQTLSLQIFGVIPFVKPLNDT